MSVAITANVSGLGDVWDFNARQPNNLQKIIK